MSLTDKLEEEVTEQITHDDHGGEGFGYYHPSQVTGCPLKVYLNKMTDHEVTPNSWMFSGSAVHYYMQETGMLEDAMLEAGFDLFGTDFEVTTSKRIGDGIFITGRCDVIAHKDGERHIYDLKYSSIPVHSGHGRLYKYLSQVNTYSFMFGADKHGLIVINSKSQDLNDAVAVVDGEPQQDNWELVKKKTKQIHSALEKGGYDDGERLDVDELEELDADGWEYALSFFDEQDIPSYDKECQYCEHKEYCPIKNGKTKGGLSSFKGGRN